MQTTTKLPSTFEQLVSAFLTHQLSDEDFQTALLAVPDLPPWLKSRTAPNPQALESSRLTKPACATCGRGLT